MCRYASLDVAVIEGNGDYYRACKSLCLTENLSIHWHTVSLSETSERIHADAVLLDIVLLGSELQSVADTLSESNPDLPRIALVEPDSESLSETLLNTGITRCVIRGMDDYHLAALPGALRSAAIRRKKLRSGLLRPGTRCLISPELTILDPSSDVQHLFENINSDDKETVFTELAAKPEHQRIERIVRIARRCHVPIVAKLGLFDGSGYVRCSFQSSTTEQDFVECIVLPEKNNDQTGQTQDRLETCRTLSSLTGDRVCWFGLNGEFLFPLSPEDALFRPESADVIHEPALLFDVFHPDDVETIIQTFYQEDRTVSTTNLRVFSATGEMHWIQVKSCELSESDGHSGRFLLCSDVTAKKREEALQIRNARNDAQLVSICKNLVDPHSNSFCTTCQNILKQSGEFINADTVAVRFPSSIEPQRSCHTWLAPGFSDDSCLRTREEVVALIESSGTSNSISVPSYLMRTQAEMAHADLNGIGPESLVCVKCDISCNHTIVLQAVSQRRGNGFRDGVCQFLYSVAKILGSGLDRLQITQQLHESRERYALATKAGRVGIWDWNAVEDTIYIDRNIRGNLGYPSNDHVYRTADWIALIHQDDRTLMQNALRNAHTSACRTFSTVTRRKCRDESWKWIQTEGTVFLGDDDSLLRIVGTDTDVTELKTTEDALRISENRWRSIYENAQAGLFCVTADTKQLLECNSRFAEIFGFNSKEDMADVFYTDEQYQEMLHLNDSQRQLDTQEELTAYETSMKKNDGTPVWVRVSARQTRDGSRIEGVLIDITEEKQAQIERDNLRDYVERSRMTEHLGKMAGGVAHHLNNSLQVILGNTELIKHSIPDHTPIADHLRAVFNATHRATSLSRQMLAYSGRSKLSLRPIDINTVARNIREHSQQRVASNISIRLFTARDLPPFLGDADQIQEAVQHLVINGAEAIGLKKGIITLSTSLRTCSREYLDLSHLGKDLPPGKYVSLTVTDTGKGIPENELQKVFDPFYTTKGPGRGLGLGAVFGILRGHGGGIRVETHPNRGSTIEILLPIPQKHALSSDVNGRRQKHTAKSKSILLCEPERIVREVTQEVLSIWGYNVVVDDIQQATQTIASAPEQYSLVLLSSEDPAKELPEVIRDLRKVAPDLPMIITSGHTENEMKNRLQHTDYIEFVQKPYQMSELRYHIDALQVSCTKEKTPGTKRRSTVPGIMTQLFTHL